MAPNADNKSGNRPTFREVIYPSLAPISFAFFLISSIGVIFASAYGSSWGWFATLLLTILTFIGIYHSRLIIEVKDGKVFVDGAQVISTDIETSNGVIHVIDTVVLPKG